MSPLSAHAREQPQASTSTSAPQTPGISTHQHTQDEQESSDDCVGESTLADTKAMALDMAETITSVVVEVADMVPVPGLEVGLLALKTVIEKIQTMQDNVEGVATLQKRVKSLAESLRELGARSDGQPLPNGMRLRIEELVESWKAIGDRARKIKSRRRIPRFLRSSRDAKKLSELVGEINDSIQDKVMIQGIMNIERYMLHIYEALKEIRAHLEASFLSTYAKKAHFDSNEVRNGCLQGTRVDILHQICTWVTTGCAHGESVPEDGIVFWINGLGGTGKTTIAYSVAQWCDLLGILGGSFFCSRSDDECNNPNLVFLTLSRQLCYRHAGFRQKVEAVLKEKPEIVDCGPYRQFEELILHPLEELKDPFPRFVFVLDALDECRDKDATATILSVIAKYVHRIAKFLLFVVTSRPEEHITARFEASRQDSLKDTTTPLLLHDVPLDIVTEDIKRYLDHEFNDKIGVLGVKRGWPSTEEKNKLAERSLGLFIYVATAVRFIMDMAYRNPKAQLRLLLEHSAHPVLSTPYRFLFALYSRIVVASYESASSELVDSIRDVLCAVVLAQESLSPSTISLLLGVDEENVRNALSGLHSVLHVPTNSYHPIKIIHPTFPEFLLQSPEAITFTPSNLLLTPPALHLRPAACHWLLFLRCTDVMIGALKRDMGGIRYPARFQSEIKDLKERVDAAIGPHVRYACRFWSFHFRDGIEGAAPLDPLPLFGEFVGKKLLYWLEACSLLDAMDKAIFALDTAQAVCQTRGEGFKDLALFLADCHRFILAYSPCIHAAPLQIYYCAISIAPTTSLVGNAFVHECKRALVVDHGSPMSWAPCLDTLRGHGGKLVQAVAFSRDGSSFVTVGWDGKATTWRTATRTSIMSFDGHKTHVNCVAYAPNGLHIASGSDDKRVCVWQPSSGECVHILEGHTDVVYSVAYSEDGRRILSATDEGEVKLWDTADGRCLLTLDKTGNSTWQVGLSPDGGVIARGDGASLCLRDVASSSSETLEFPDVVQACAFSPDSRYIAARSKRIIRVWRCADKSLVRSIEVAEDLTSRLAFSRNGTLMGCGSKDGSACLWPIASEDSPRTLQRHTNPVRDVTYNPDESQAISVADDGMIRVWDLTSSSILTQERLVLRSPTPAPGPPLFALVGSGKQAIALLNLVALGIDPQGFPIGTQMPDDAPTATLFPDVFSAHDAALRAVADYDGGTTNREWWLLTGQGHSQLSDRPLAVSSNSTLMAYSSPMSDTIVNICDLRTGTVVTTLAGHAGGVCSIAFSLDHARLATGSFDNSVNIWDTASGASLCEHSGHRGRVRAVAFSPDGRLVSSGSDDKTVRIFKVATERVICVLDQHRHSVMQVMFAADNIHLVALDLSHWAYIWDITTGTRVREFSVQDDSWIRSPFFSPDGTGIIVGNDRGVSRSISLWNPGTRTWPVYWVTQDGWVHAMRPGRTQRLCWLPPEWREPLASYEGTLCIHEAESELYEARRLIVLNLSQLVEYIDTLDAE